MLTSVLLEKNQWASDRNQWEIERNKLQSDFNEFQLVTKIKIKAMSNMHSMTIGDEYQSGYEVVIRQSKGKPFFFFPQNFVSKMNIHQAFDQAYTAQDLNSKLAIVNHVTKHVNNLLTSPVSSTIVKSCGVTSDHIGAIA